MEVDSVKHKSLVLVVFLMAVTVAFAQTPAPKAPVTKAADPIMATPTIPELSEVDKLKVQNVLLRIELAQRAAQQAQTDFDRARTEATTLLQGLQKPGFELDLQALTYKAVTPKADPVPPVVKK